MDNLPAKSKDKKRRVSFGPLRSFFKARRNTKSSRRHSLDASMSSDLQVTTTLGGSLVGSNREHFSDDEKTLRRCGSETTLDHFGLETVDVIQDTQSWIIREPQDPKGSQNPTGSQDQAPETNGPQDPKGSQDQEPECNGPQDPKGPQDQEPECNGPQDPKGPQDQEPGTRRHTKRKHRQAEIIVQSRAIASDAGPSTSFQDLYVHGTAWVEQTLSTSEISFPHLSKLPDIPMHGYTKLWIDGANRQLMLLTSDGQISMVGQIPADMSLNNSVGAETLEMRAANNHRLSVGDVISLAPSNGLLCKGFAVYSDFDLLSQITDPISDTISGGLLGVRTGMTCNHDISVIDNDLVAWVLCSDPTASASKCHLLLGILGEDSRTVNLAGSAFAINHGNPISYPVIRAVCRMQDDKLTNYLLVWFECITEQKNKVEVLRVEYDKEGVPLVTTAFGPAKAAGPGAYAGRIALIGEKRAAFVRQRENTLEVVPVDMTRLPIIVMGSPVQIFEDQVPIGTDLFDATGITNQNINSDETVPSDSWTDTPRGQYEWPNLVITTPTLRGISVMEGRVALPGPIFYRGQETVVSIAQDQMKLASTVENLGSNAIAVIHNCPGGIGISCFTVNPLKPMSHTANCPILLHPKQASVIRTAKLSRNRIVVSHLNGIGSDKKTGLVHIVDGSNIASRKPNVSYGSAPWSHTQSSSDFSLSASPDGSTFYLSSDKGLQKGTLLSDCAVSFTNGSIGTHPIGIVREILDNGRIIVTRRGLQDIQNQTLVPGIRYYGHNDGSISVSSHSLDPSVYSHGIPVGIAMSPSRLAVEIAP